ncbi:hypothetical protein ABZ733_10090 [Streptomyces longwoodensis]|uniref:hypothetical protein n=1 Tax=Streptomyces longwoodensis TaxID=68231 RepID=UPI003400610B
MHITRPARKAAVSLALGITACVAAGTFCVPAATAATGGPAPLTPATTHTAAFRQLIGHVSGPAYLEASVPASGSYTIEYQITGNAAFDTYVNGAELGYVGGSTGTYRTRTVKLPAGGVLVQVAGPEGSGQAAVYLVSVS